MLLLSVFDKEAKTYDTCFTKTTQAEATREFILACRNDQCMYKQFPEQFELHLLATIDTDGNIFYQYIDTENNTNDHQISSLIKPKVIITAENVMQMAEISEKNLPENLQNSAS